MAHGTYRLRAMEPQDAHLLHGWENRMEEWWLGAQLVPISLEAMQRFARGEQDVWADRQVRLMLEVEGQTAGALDLYGIDPRNQRAGVGIVLGTAFRGKGHAGAGLRLLLDYAFDHLGLRMLFAEVPTENPSSLLLFEAAGFQASGVLRQWVRRGNRFSDLQVMQAFRPTGNGDA